MLIDYLQAAINDVRDYGTQFTSAEVFSMIATAFKLALISKEQFDALIANLKTVTFPEDCGIIPLGPDDIDILI